MNNDLLETIICKNDIKIVLSKIEELLQNTKNIKNIKVVDENDDEIVILVSDTSITEREAKMWWSGYQAWLLANN